MIDALKKIEALIDQNKILERRNEELRNIIDINLTQSPPEISEPFSSFIDISEVENLLLKFFQFNKVAVALFEKEGKLLFTAGMKPFCHNQLQCEHYLKRHCFEKLIWNEKDISGRSFQLNTCLNGMNLLVLPVMMRNSFMGTLVVSQFLKESDNLDRIFDFKAKIKPDIDKDNFIKELEHLPVLSDIEINALINNANYLAEMLGYLCKNNQEFHFRFQQQADKEIVLTALKDKIMEQEQLLKQLSDNMVEHQHQIGETTISKSDQSRELSQLNKRLERTETLLSTLLTSIPLGIGFVRQDTFTYVNEQMFKITGFTPKELIGRRPEFLFSTDNINIFNFTPEYQFIPSSNSYELQLNRKNGDRLDTIVFSSPLNPEDLEEGWTVSILDITEMKAMQLELIAAKEKAEESDRLKNAFLCNMSHELRNPMNSLVGFTELLSKEDVDESKKSTYVKIIRSSSDKLLSLIDDIIDVSMITTNQLVLNKQIFSLSHLLEDIQRIYKQFIQTGSGSRISLKYTVAEPLRDERVFNDEIRLRQVFCNLLSNAVKFTGKGEIEFGYEVKGSFIEFFIRDTGQGIKKAQMAYIFDCFRQGDDSYTRKHGGAGLGLTLAKDLIGLMGGKIWVESHFGKGSTFFFTIPQNLSPQKEILIETELNLTQDWSDHTILIAEDEEVNFLYLQQLLLPTKINIQWVQNGQKAVDFCTEHPEVNLILMDIKMPVMNGLEATRIIKSHRSNLPVIAQTAYAHGNNREDFMKAGCDDFIAKPIPGQLFMKKVGNFLNKEVN